LGERNHRRRGGALEDHRQARATLHARQRSPGHRLPSQEIRRRDRPVGLVGSQTLTLTRSDTELRHDVLAIIRAGIRACDAAALVSRALAGAPGAEFAARGSEAGRAGPEVLIAAGKAAREMAAAATRHRGRRIRAGLIVAPTADAKAPTSDPGASTSDPLTVVAGGHPVPTA